MELLVPYKSEQCFFVVPVLTIFDKELPACVPCTIINTTSDDIVLLKTDTLVR